MNQKKRLVKSGRTIWPGFVVGFLFVIHSGSHFVAASELPPLIEEFSNSDIQNHRVKIDGNFKDNPFSLECSGSGKPIPEFQWFKNGAPVEEAGLTVAGNVLTFETGHDHQGYYYCTASNDLGTAKSSVITLTPDEEPDWASDGFVAPEFTSRPENILAQEGKDAIIKCEASGDPVPDIYWTKNGEELVDANDLNELAIQSVGPEDIGTYSCNASNSVGYVYKVVYLIILNQDPFFLETPTNRTVSIGQEAILRCSAKGYPNPNITWEYESEATENYVVTPNQDLKINQVKETDEGRFTCTATNEFGSIKSSGYLKVVSTTTIIEGPPPESTVEIFENIRLPCTVIWDPNYKLTIIWKKDNENIVTSDKISIDSQDHSLTIKNLDFEDSGGYFQVTVVPLIYKQFH